MEPSSAEHRSEAGSTGSGWEEDMCDVAARQGHRGAAVAQEAAGARLGERLAVLAVLAAANRSMSQPTASAPDSGAGNCVFHHVR